MQQRNVYGSDSDKIDSLICENQDWANAIHQRLPYRAVNVAWAARQEMALTVEDVLARRTRALFLDARAAIEAAPLVADILQKELNRSNDWKRDQMQQFAEVARGYVET